jgi:hypothetical protein
LSDVRSINRHEILSDATAELAEPRGPIRSNSATLASVVTMQAQTTRGTSKQIFDFKLVPPLEQISGEHGPR